MNSPLGARHLSVLTAMIFLSDLAYGVIGPTFSLFVVSLGGSLALVGAIGAVFSLSRLLSSIPAGMASDVWGRKGTLCLGLAFLSGATFTYSLTKNPELLLIFRILEGLSAALILTTGITALTDDVRPDRRGRVLGVYMTAMGLGYAIGSALGGIMVQALDFVRAFQLTTLAPAIALALVVLGYHPAKKATAYNRPVFFNRTTMLKLSMHPRLLPANLGNFLIGLTFSGATVAFFPLYAVSIGMTAAVLGTAFGIRGLVSTIVRLPAGILSRHHARHLMLGSLVLVGLVMLAVPAMTQPNALVSLLMLEGLAYGVFVTSGQSYIDASAEGQRGTVQGVYATYGSLGSMVGAFVLGILAQFVDLASVFYATAIVVGIGVLAMLWLWRKASTPVANLSGEVNVKS